MIFIVSTGSVRRYLDVIESHKSIENYQTMVKKGKTWTKYSSQIQNT